MQPSVSTQHFGVFDRTASLYSGFDSGTCTFPALPKMVDGNSNETLTIPDVSCPVDSSASHQSDVSLLFSLVYNYIQQSPNIFVFMSPHYKTNLNWIAIFKDGMKCNILTRQATAILLSAREKHHLSQVCPHTLLHLFHLLLYWCLVWEWGQS